MRMNLAKKIISLLSIIRGYNILILIIAQYFAAIFIFSNTHNISIVFSDIYLFYTVTATVCTVAGGYIINDFYDIKADKINRPVKSKIDNIISQETRLRLYFTLNLIAFVFSYFVSWRACLFFSTYIFLIWFYSHKIKNKPILGLILIACLTIAPFFVLFIFYKNFSTVIFVHAFYLFFVILIRELIKNLENIQGLIVNNNNTFSVVFGEGITKKVILVLIVLTLLSVSLIFYFPIGEMKYYFYGSIVTLLFVGFYIKKAIGKNEYRMLHNILKILLLIGVFSISLSYQF